MAAGDNNDAVTVTTALETLLAAGADVRAKNMYGGEPLHDAVKNGSVQAAAAGVLVLLAAGADALAKDTNGFTPLALGASA